MYRWLGTIGAATLLLAVSGLEIGCTQTVVSIDGNQLPSADAGKNQSVSDKDGSGVAPVWLDGAQSADPDGDIVDYEWSTGAEVLAAGAAPRVKVSLPVGQHNIRLTVSDAAGGSATDDVEIVVRASNAALAWSENFEDYPDGATLNGWRDTGRNNSLSSSPGLFATMGRVGAIAFGTANAGDNIHTHFISPRSDSWTNYEFTGRMLRGDSQGGVGVTFFSNFTHEDRYYALRAYWGEPFELSARGTILFGLTASNVIAISNTWYRFRVQVEDGGSATHVRARVWRDGDAEPVEWLMVAGDASTTRCTGGAVGVWCMGAGEKYVDDLAVRETNFKTQEGRQVVLTAGADQVLIDTDGDGMVTVTLDGSGAMSDVDCYRWRESGRILAEGPSPIAVVNLAVGYHIITLESCDGKHAVSDKVEIEIQPYDPPDCYTSDAAWRNFSVSRQGGVFTTEFVATPSRADIDGLFALSHGGGVTYSDYAVLVRFSHSGVIDARNGDGYSAETSFPYQAGATYEFRLVVDCSAKMYDVFVAPKGGAEKQIADDYAFRSEQLNVIALDNWAIQSGLGEFEICDVSLESPQGEPQNPVANAGVDQTVLDADGDGSETVMFDGRNSYDPDGTILNYRWLEGSTLLAMGPDPTVNVNLSTGAHVITLSVTDDGGYHDTDTVQFTINEAGGGGETDMLSSVYRHGITWTFDRQYPVGEFVNGDFYVVGPVTISAISPAPGGGRNGSMVNPTGADVQGYDSRAYHYDAGLGVTPPFTLNVNQSLVSTKSDGVGDVTFIEMAAVLTCLADAPPDGMFRPHYCGNTKPLYHVSQLRMDLLPNLSPVAGTPSVNAAASKIERLWLDHQPNWHGKLLHPRQNMPHYGREIATEINDAALMTLLNVADKDVLVIRLVQLGIDFNGIIDAGGGWSADGGHGSGRKWPILFAGLMLNNAHMLDIGYRDAGFGEDCQTFYVSQEDVDRGVGYTPSDLGRPEWGIRHCYAPHQDNAAWDTPYRQCCTANAWVGAVLSAHLLDLVGEWNHAALFDYQDRYMATEPPGDFRSWSSFAEAMWDTYR